MKKIIILLIIALILFKKKSANIIWHNDEEVFDFPDEDGNYETTSNITTNEIIKSTLEDKEAIEREHDIDISKVVHHLNPNTMGGNFTNDDYNFDITPIDIVKSEKLSTKKVKKTSKVKKVEIPTTKQETFTSKF